MDKRNQLQINISMPNLINICVGQKVDGEISGEIYHCYAKEPMRFSNVVEMIKKIEDLFDRICFPQSSTKLRSFCETSQTSRMLRPEKVLMQQDVIEYRGTLGSFVTCVKFRQNSTWQGEIFWMEKSIKRQFTNTLDFIKILDNALMMVEKENKRHA